MPRKEKEGFRNPTSVLQQLRKARRTNEQIRKMNISNNRISKAISSFNRFRSRVQAKGQGGDLFQSKNSLGKRGRPEGSYDSRYAKFGGVYGYRKVLLAQLREKRMEDIRRTSLTPEEQNILARIEQQKRAREINPENQIIPDTKGEVFLGGIHKEIQDACNEVP